MARYWLDSSVRARSRTLLAARLCEESCGGWRPTIILSAELRMVDAGQGGAARQPAASSQLSFMRSASCCLHDYGASGSNRLTAAGQVLRPNDSPRRNLPFVFLRGDRPLHLQQQPFNSDGPDEGQNDSSPPRRSALRDPNLPAVLLRSSRLASHRFSCFASTKRLFVISHTRERTFPARSETRRGAPPSGWFRATSLNLSSARRGPRPPIDDRSRAADVIPSVGLLTSSAPRNVRLTTCALQRTRGSAPTG